MIRLFCAMCLIVMAAQQFARADSGGDDTFCASAPIEMIKAIEGNWTLKQGAGYGAGGILPFPLPAQPPQSVWIDVDTGKGIAYLKHDGQKIAIIPVLPSEALAQEMRLDEAEQKGLLNTGGGCEWYSLPIMLGSNVYELSDAAAKAQGGADGTSIAMVVTEGEVFYACSNGKMDSFKTTVSEILGEGVAVVEKSNDAPEKAETINKYCEMEDIDTPDPRVGEMVMNLLVKFKSPDSGTGILQFKGQYGATVFAARAPVTFTR